MWTDPAKMTETEIEAELAALNLSEPGWEIQARHWRLSAELRFRQRSETMNNPADQISQAERRKLLAEDRQRLNTYRAHAEADADLELGGRFAEVTTTVIGAGPISYPRQPEGSPWACDPCPTEPPLKYDINEMEPVGEVHERSPEAVRKSRRLRRL
jgi:hypothetical protein